MHFLLFVFEMVLVLGGIALVPARFELSPSRNIERERENSLRPNRARDFELETIWICEMTCDETDPQQGDDMDLLVQVSDEALEAAGGGLMQGLPTLAYGSYCVTCRPHLH